MLIFSIILNNYRHRIVKDTDDRFLNSELMFMQAVVKLIFNVHSIGSH